MHWCQDCGAEHEEYAQRCAFCEGELVDTPADQAPEPDHELVTVELGRELDPAAARLMLQLLDGSNIPYQVVDGVTVQVSPQGREFVEALVAAAEHGSAAEVLDDPHLGEYLGLGEGEALDPVDDPEAGEPADEPAERTADGEVDGTADEGTDELAGEGDEDDDDGPLAGPSTGALAGAYGGPSGGALVNTDDDPGFPADFLDDEDLAAFLDEADEVPLWECYDLYEEQGVPFAQRVLFHRRIPLDRGLAEAFGQFLLTATVGGLVIGAVSMFAAVDQGPWWLLLVALAVALVVVAVRCTLCDVEVRPTQVTVRNPWRTVTVWPSQVELADGSYAHPGYAGAGWIDGKFVPTMPASRGTVATVRGMGRPVKLVALGARSGRNHLVVELAGALALARQLEADYDADLRARRQP